MLNTTPPTLTRLGTLSRNASPATRAALSRDGATSVAVIEPDTSVTSMIEARSSGTATVISGLAAATTSTASAIA